MNVDDLILKHNIKLNNKHDFKLIFWWNEPFRIEHANSIKDIYILKEINEIHLERIYANNRLKRFKTRNVENLSTKQIKIHKMLNITFENLIDAMKKSNIVNKDVRIDDEIRNEVARNIVENSDAGNQIVMIKDQNRIKHVRESRSWQRLERHVIYVDCQERSIWLHKIDLKSTIDINRSDRQLLTSKNNRPVDLLQIKRLRFI